MASVLGFGWYLSSRLTKIENRLESLEKKLRSLATLFQEHLSLTALLVSIFHRNRILTGEEFQEIQSKYIAMTGIVEIPVSPNPVTAEEASKVHDYLEKGKKGYIYSDQEIDELLAIIKKVEKEKGDDPNLLPLFAIGAFLLGLYLGSKK